MSKSFLQRIVAGDAYTAVNFYKLYSPKISLYLAKRLPSSEDAQEVTNDVFLEAIDSLSMLRDEKNILAWLYKIAQHKTVDFYRKRKIKSLLLSQMPFLQLVDAEVHQPEFQFEKNRIRDKIELAMHSLSYEYQQILKMRYEEQMPVKKIALILNLSFKATESLLFRARKSFMLAYEESEALNI
jgi:RNA polymerase sigma-70 factor, ECF subfamily